MTYSSDKQYSSQRLINWSITHAALAGSKHGPTGHLLVFLLVIDVCIFDVWTWLRLSHYFITFSSSIHLRKSVTQQTKSSLCRKFCYWNLCIYTLLLCCSDNVVNAVWPQTIAGSLVSAVARGRETNSKDRRHRRWQWQKKTFNICCLKAVSLRPSNVSPFVVAEPDVSTGQNNITLQTGSLKQAKAVVTLLLRKSVERL